MGLSNWLKRKAAIIGLAMANVEKNALSQKGDALDSDIKQERRHTQGQLMDALLHGEITQEVKDMRWRTYKVLKEMQVYRTTITGKDDEGYLITKTERVDLSNDLKKLKLDPTDNFPLDLMVNNDDLITGDILDNISLKTSDEPIKNEDADGNVESATHAVIDGHSYYASNKPDKTISINREFMSRFDIEAYTKKMVVRSVSDTEKILEFYVSKYPDEFNRNSRLFLSEVNKAITNPRTSDMLDIKSVMFITYKAVGVHDFLEYEYKIDSFYKIVEFDGNYVIKFKATVVKNGDDILEQYRQTELDAKYANKEKRQ